MDALLSYESIYLSICLFFYKSVCLSILLFKCLLILLVFHKQGPMYLLKRLVNVCFCHQAAKLPMSIIIVGVGQAEFDGKCFFKGHQLQ